MMTDDEKKKFLKQMGFNPRLLDSEITNTTKKKDKDKDKVDLGIDGLPKNHVDKQELLSLYRIFNKGDEKDGK